MSIFTESFQYDILKMDNQPLLHQTDAFCTVQFVYNGAGCQICIVFSAFHRLSVKFAGFFGTNDCNYYCWCV